MGGDTMRRQFLDPLGVHMGSMWIPAGASPPDVLLPAHLRQGSCPGEAVEESEERRLRAEEGKLAGAALSMEREIQAQKRAEEGRGKEQLRVQGSRHYEAKMNLRAMEVRDSLEEDRRILQRIMDEEARERSSREEGKNWQEELDKVRRVLEEQASHEKEREKVLENMFDEEARRMFEKREAEWTREAEARRRLMEDVIGGWREQMEERKMATRKEREGVERERKEIFLQLRHLEQMFLQLRDLEQMFLQLRHLQQIFLQLRHVEQMFLQLRHLQQIFLQLRHLEQMFLQY
ncbi:unnamed protein product [Cyprideis torosa]|uniref:Uncharacterized protein n=1 Tax=Cyprideis torosa TaxID=163714 RepID=A0A7R8WIR5_9CRUS|nr:unnamed protein product [Cyprideis torosa]CAG0894807.1 unnamed protein product [Cyprideis torosa]